MKLHIAPCLIALVLGGACADSGVSLPTAPAAPMDNQLSAYLTASTTTPAVGDDVTVSLNARRGRDAAAVGSFAIDIAFDPALLTFVAALPTAEGMTAANAVSSSIRVAGASGGGFGAERLVSVVVRVKSPGALESLRLSIAELNSTAYGDLRASTVVASRVFAQGAEPTPR